MANSKSSKIALSNANKVSITVEIPESNLQLLSALIGSWNGKIVNSSELTSEPVVETKVSTKASDKVVAKATTAVAKCKAVARFFEEKSYKNGYTKYSLKENTSKVEDINKLMSSKSEGWSYSKNAYSILCAEEFKELFTNLVDFEEIAKLDEITRNEQAYKVLKDFITKDKKSLWYKTKDFTGLLLNGYVVSLKETTYKVPNAKNAKKSTTIRFNKVETLKLF